MRPVVVTAILLVVLMFMSDSAAWNPEEMCRTKYPAIPCRKNFGEGWFQMGHHRCVKAFYHQQGLSFYAAERVCKQYRNGNTKGHLVSIHSIVELCQVECAMYRVNTGKPHYWIGLRKIWIDDVRVLAWTDNTNYDFSHWARWQPDNYLFREKCTEMNYGGWGLWNDESCDQRRSFVCAIRL